MGKRSMRNEARKAAQEAASGAWPDLTGVHAFLIEDNEDTRALVGDTLEHCGAVVSVYSSADAAIADLPEFVPTVFISDLSMPGLDGLVAAARARSK